MIRSVYKIYQNIYLRVYGRLSHLLTSIYFSVNGVQADKFTSIGIPILDINITGQCKMGSGLIMINNAKFAMLGKSNRCKIVISAGGRLTIGDKVGMSNTTLIATSSIILGNNILIGGGVTIVDTDFHSLDSSHWHSDDDAKNMRSSPVVIKDNVFIGMDTIILKGVTVGSNVIIAAGSVVSKDIPDDQIWGGNPAQFIRDNKIES